jgi:hypothetical protein
MTIGFNNISRKQGSIKDALRFLRSSVSNPKEEVGGWVISIIQKDQRLNHLTARGLVGYIFIYLFFFIYIYIYIYVYIYIYTYI